jgi:tight adherence protein B
MSWLVISFLCLVVLSVALFITGALSFWHMHWGPSAMIVKQRLQSMTSGVATHNRALVKTRTLSSWPPVHTWLSRVPHIEHLDSFLSQAAVTWDVAQFLTRVCLLWLGSAVVLMMLGIGFVVAWGLGTFAVLVAFVYLQQKRHQRVQLIEAQLPDTLDLMARAMQAGHAFSSAMMIVAAEGSIPIRGEFQITFDEINFGIPTATAMHHLTTRVASSDLRFFVVAVLIQLETGGNLTEILKSLASLIRERQRIAGSVRILTAEGRLSAWILGLLPFAIASLLTVINPEFISKLWTDPLGIRMLQVSLGLMLLGVIWMWRMVRIEI